jgi:hypothetical protein
MYRNLTTVEKNNFDVFKKKRTEKIWKNNFGVFKKKMYGKDLLY